MLRDISEIAVFLVYAVFFLLMAIEGRKKHQELGESRTISGDIEGMSYTLVVILTSILSAVGFYWAVLLICEAATM